MLRHGPHVRRHEPIRLGRWHERAVYLSIALLVISGVLWLVFHHFLRVRGEFGSSPHPLEYWWLRLHGAAAMLSLIVIGSMLPVHVRRAWELRKNIATGLAASGVLAVLVLTGYALYYFAGGSSRAFISATHWIIGLALPIVIAWHAWRGRMRRKATDETDDQRTSTVSTSAARAMRFIAETDNVAPEMPSTASDNSPSFKRSPENWRKNPGLRISSPRVSR